ncbi:hypothetical protein Q5752_001896 [Cryptotrichosporon argae]
MATPALPLRRRSASTASPRPDPSVIQTARRHSASPARTCGGGTPLPPPSHPPDADTATAEAVVSPPRTPRPWSACFVHPPHSAGPSRRGPARALGASLPCSPTAPLARAELRALGDKLEDCAGGRPGAPCAVPCALEVLGELEGGAGEGQTREDKRARGWARLGALVAAVVHRAEGALARVPITGPLLARAVHAASAFLALPADPDPLDVYLQPMLGAIVAHAVRRLARVPHVGPPLSHALDRAATLVGHAAPAPSPTPELEPSSTLNSTPDPNMLLLHTPPVPSGLLDPDHAGPADDPHAHSGRSVFQHAIAVRLLANTDTFPSNPYPGKSCAMGLDTGVTDTAALLSSAMRR